MLKEKFNVVHHDELEDDNKLIYTVEALGSECKVSWGNRGDFMYYTSQKVEDFIKRGVWVVILNEVDEKYTKLEKDFITLEKNYETVLDEISKLKKQLEDKDKCIKRLNLEAQRWFDNCMDLMYPPKETD